MESWEEIGCIRHVECNSGSVMVNVDNLIWSIVSRHELCNAFTIFVLVFFSAVESTEHDFIANFVRGTVIPSWVCEVCLRKFCKCEIVTGVCDVSSEVINDFAGRDVIRGGIGGW
jgi:hypothetical protein